MDIFLMKRFLSSGFLSFLLLFSKAQDNKISLRQAVETALAHNLQVKQSDLQMQTANVYWNQSKASMIPNLNGSLNNGTTQGRSIDPFTNAYINQQLNSASLSLNTGVTVFNG